ncbi:conserved hypothetical protein [uncultured Dysgonomonas sp.]|uniref:Uncharacterized protein n=2 Tax=uncultured Dysgonomonas sp. TaxID=206096 RepID=A0A212J3H6_9BACT|nr:conserved hypothetical protein [uncultured Dysgonomonas sp.]
MGRIKNYILKGNMRIIRETGQKKFPLKWANLKNYPKSKAYRKEIYLKNDNDLVVELKGLFYNLFDKYKTDILIYDSSWWNFTLDTWNIQNNTYDYSVENKSKETKGYLSMLGNSEIEKGYSGVCECLDWEKYLQIVIPCIVFHEAPYSHIFYNEIENFFFYFHHTGSIGLYYEEESETMLNILNLAEMEYLVE